MKIGWIGTGVMGRSMAGHVQAAGHELFVHNRTKAKTEELLKERGWPQEYVRAVVSHGWGLCSDVEPRSLLEKTLYAVDELVGFVTACALVRPSRSVMDLDARSVLKKWKQKSFAASVNREVIEKGAAMLGVDLNVLVQEVIAGMRKVAPQIGL